MCYRIRSNGSGGGCSRSAGPILHKEMVLRSLPVLVPVLKLIVAPGPAVEEVDDPRAVHLVMRLSVASLWNRIALAPKVAVVLEIVSKFPGVLGWFKPSMFTLSPDRLEIDQGWPPRLPVIVHAPFGIMEMFW